MLLSGSIDAKMVHGKLEIKGNTAANAIVLDQSGLTSSQVRITGTSGTTINHHTKPVIINGVTRGILIRMSDAADSVTLQNMRITGDVSIDGNGGLNTVVVNNVHVTKSLDIQDGARISTTAISKATVGTDMTIVAGTGGQNVSLRSVHVLRDTRILTGGMAAAGAGVATIKVDDSDFDGAVRIRTGAGNDNVQLDTNGDPLGKPTSFHGLVSVSLNAGNDTLQLGIPGQSGNRSLLAHKVQFDGGTGHDTLRNFDATTYSRKTKLSIASFESTIVVTDTIAPTVTITDPAVGATGVALNKKIAATFSEPIDPSTMTSTNVRVLAPGQVKVAGTVSHVGRTLLFTPTSTLAANTTYTITITTGIRDLAGNPLARNFVTKFTTGATADVTAPTISSSDPANSATGVALNRKIAATFSEAMDPSTITTANVKVTSAGNVPVSGTVAYVGTTMTFTPSATLAANTVFTVTITKGAKDLAGNALASNSVTTFTTGAAVDSIAPTVSTTSPGDLQTNVVLNKTVAATFSESMDALTLSTADFTVSGPGNANVAGTVHYDAASNIVSFIPTSNLAPNTTYTATITGGSRGAKDLAGNALVNNKVWTFTTGTQTAQAPINLGAAGTFAVMATSAVSGAGITRINGDVGLNPGSAQGLPPSEVNGSIHVDDQAIIQAQADLLSAYNDAVSRSTTSQTLPGNVGGLTFTPGLYTNSSSVVISGAGPNNNVTLDAQGDPNAIFIFQMASTLTTGPGSQVILTGGAKASNVFWQVGSSATIDTTTQFSGNVLASVSITTNAGAVINGRLLAGANGSGAVTVNGSTVTVPAA